MIRKHSDWKCFNKNEISNIGSQRIIIWQALLLPCGGHKTKISNLSFLLYIFDAKWIISCFTKDLPLWIELCLPVRFCHKLFVRMYLMQSNFVLKLMFWAETVVSCNIFVFTIIILAAVTDSLTFFFILVTLIRKKLWAKLLRHKSLNLIYFCRSVLSALNRCKSPQNYYLCHLKAVFLFALTETKIFSNVNCQYSLLVFVRNNYSLLLCFKIETGGSIFWKKQNL